MKSTFLTAFLAFSALISANNLIPAPKNFSVKNDKRAELKKIVFKKQKTASPDEYFLKINNGVVEISGNENWAKSTLEQLYDANRRLPNVEIHDFSAFEWRGFMHDTGRNFIPLNLIKQTLDLMWRYKFNLFHWHLTDHPAWRIESKAFPELNDPRNQRPGRDVGLFYTYAEIREIFTYARERGITVLPEIDIPGHSTYFPQTFSCTMDSERGMEILKTCFEEFFAEIPAEICPFIHLGSDEVRIEKPQEFMDFFENLAIKNNRQPVIWDPGLPASNRTIRQIWNEASAKNLIATQNENRFFDSFVGYLNYYDPLVFTNRIFLHQACGENPDTTRALGGILCLWNDVKCSDKSLLSPHNGQLSGMLAFAERFWNGGGNLSDLHPNLPPAPDTENGKRLAEFENRMAFHRDSLLKTADFRWVKNAHIPWQIKVENADWQPAFGGAVDLDAFCQGYKLSPADTTVALAKTEIFVQNDTVIRAWVGFEAPARSNRISAGIGKQNCWENSGKIYIISDNDTTEILPPTLWNEPEKYAFHFNTWAQKEEEFPYTNEQFYWMRTPAFLPLKKGKNTVLMRIPRSFKGQRWSFAFLPVCVKSSGTVSEATGIEFNK